MRSTIYAGTFGVVLLLGYLMVAQPERAEAGITGNLTVVNHSNVRVRFYVSGEYHGVVEPNSYATTHVGHDPDERTILRAEADAPGDRRVWNGEVRHHVRNYTWTLTN